MPTKLVLTACAALLLLSAPIAAHAAEGAPPPAGSGSSTPGEPATGEPPPATLSSEAPPATVEEEEAEEEALSGQAEARLAAEESGALQRIAHEAVEEEQLGKPAGTATTRTCLVPLLRGDTLRAARRALTIAHCKLGRVSTPRGRRAKLVVTRQGKRAGALLPNGTPVAVRLGKRRSKRAGA